MAHNYLPDSCRNVRAFRKYPMRDALPVQIYVQDTDAVFGHGSRGKSDFTLYDPGRPADSGKSISPFKFGKELRPLGRS